MRYRDTILMNRACFTNATKRKRSHELSELNLSRESRRAACLSGRQASDLFKTNYPPVVGQVFRMKTHKKILLLIILIIACCSKTFANPKVHAYTKITEKTYSFSKHNELVINAEKAQIKIVGKQQSNIQIKISLISRNTDQNIAKNELKYLEANISKSLYKIFVNNYIIIPNDVKNLSSDFQIIYEISIPQDYAKIILENKLGEVKMNGLNGNFLLKTEYCDIEMRNLSGTITLNSKFGDINCDQCNMEGHYTMTYAKINLIQLGGNNTIKTKSGTMIVQPKEKIGYLIIDSKSTNITVINQECNNYNYNISANLGTIYITESCMLKNKKDIKVDTRETKKSSPQFISTHERNNGSIKIDSDFEDVHIQ
jgi:hypothetical protein